MSAARALVHQEEVVYEAPRPSTPMVAMTPEQLQALIVGIKGSKSTTAPTLDALFEKYTLVRQHETNWRVVKRRLDPLARRLGTLPASELTPIVWAEHRAARAQEVHYRGGLPSPALLNRELERAKEMLKWAVTNQLLDRNPLASAKGTSVVSARETWLRPEDVDKLLAAVSHVCDGRGSDAVEYRPLILRAFILVCVDSGLRKNEARLLRRDRIGADGIVELAARQTKSRRRRIVALTQRTLDAINAIPTEWRFIPTTCKNPIVTSSHEPYVFINPRTGDLLSDRTLWYWFRKAVVIAGLDTRCAPGDVRLRVHDLRHTAASIADLKGASATAIRDLLGHTSLGITQRYLHRDQRAGAIALAMLMDPSPSKITVGELYRRYAEQRQYQSSWRLIRNRLEPLARALADLPAIELTPAAWADYCARRAKGAAPPSDATLNTDLQRTKEMLRWGVGASLLKTNPLLDALPHVRRGKAAKGGR